MVRNKILVGNNSCEIKKISKPLIRIVISLQKQLQEEENKRNKYKPRKISFVYASLELSRRIK